MVREFIKYRSEHLGIIVIENLFEDGTIKEYFFDLMTDQKLMDYQLERLFRCLDPEVIEVTGW